MAHSKGRIHADVVFVQPPGFAANWARTDLWTSAGLIAGVTRTIDDGREGHIFGVATSGQTTVYDARGRLVFSGGITGARGHFGDNSGVEEISALLKNSSSAKSTVTPVYGCALFGRDSSRGRVKPACLK